MNGAVRVGLALLLGWVATTAAEEPVGKPGRKIDQPIPQTYQPLMPGWVDVYSSEVRDAKELRKSSKTPKHAATSQSGQPAQQFPIHEPLPASDSSTHTGVLEEGGNELRIRD